MTIIKQGDRVAIINFSNGKYFLEGYARLLGEISPTYWRVELETDGVLCERYVDPEAQKNPEAYIDELNRG